MSKLSPSPLLKGRGVPVFASQDQGPGKVPPLPCPLLPQREERGKMGGSGAASGATGRNQTHERGVSSPSPLLRGRGPGVWTFCGLDSTQSQRDCITQPRVARGTLPWVCAPIFSRPYGLQPHSSAAHSRHYAAAIGIDDRERDDRYNPCRVGSLTRHTPRVARNAQPWAK